MPIAGSMQNCVRVWIRDGKPMVGSSQRADKSKISETPEAAVAAVLAGQEYVYLLLYNDNIERFKVAFATRMGFPVFK